MWISFGLGACSGWLIFQFLIVFFSPKDAFFCFFQWEILWLYWLFRQFRFLSPAPGLFDPQKTFTLNFQVPCGLFNFAGLLNFFFFFNSHILAKFSLLEFNSWVIDFIIVSSISRIVWFGLYTFIYTYLQHQFLFKSKDYLDISYSFGF